MHKTGRPISLKGPIGDLARIYPGGVQGLASHLGVHRSTVGKWARNVRPGGPARKALEALFTVYKVQGRPW